MPKAERHEGDPELHDLFERFSAQLFSPGGAALSSAWLDATVEVLLDQPRGYGISSRLGRLNSTPPMSAKRARMRLPRPSDAC